MTEPRARLVYADAAGRIFDHPYLEMVGRQGQRWVRVSAADLLPLPPGSDLFVLPGRLAVGYDPRRRRFVVPELGGGQGGPAYAVAAFMAPAHTMHYLAAFHKQKDAPVLPLFAYTAVGWYQGQFYVAGWRSDPDVRQDPENFDCREIAAGVTVRRRQEPHNRLLAHLAHCALNYGCPAARNLFLGRWEAPLPTSQACNARCLGCLSYQEHHYFPAPMRRIRFLPTVAEIAGVAVPHLETAPRAVVSFGQGCEGEPLLRAATLAAAIRELRRQTARGTINLNTNGSLPRAVGRLVEAGLDSLRLSINSLRPAYYTAYYRPQGYTLAEVLESLRIAKAAGAKVAINYLIFPGLTDEPEEVARLEELIATTGLDLIQWRNLNIDPDFYLQGIGYRPAGRPLGLRQLRQRLARQFPGLRFGYFNPPWRG